MKMRAEINCTIPDIITKTSKSYEEEQLVCHRSPHFFDEKDDQRSWCLKIKSQLNYLHLLTKRDEKYDVILFVKLCLQEEFIMATWPQHIFLLSVMKEAINHVNLYPKKGRIPPNL